MRRDLILTAGLLLALAAAIWLCCPADAAELKIETSTIVAVNQDTELGVSLSVGAVVPPDIWVLGGRYLFLDLLEVSGDGRLGASVSLSDAEHDDGIRFGATWTKPPDGGRPQVEPYFRYAVRF